MDWNDKKKNLNYFFTFNQREELVIAPDSKDPVKQESSKEAEDNVGPRVPGVQLHELCRVQVQILNRWGRREAHLILVI